MTAARNAASDRVQVKVFGATCLVVVIGLLGLRALVPSPLAPRVNIRWEVGIDAGARAAMEKQFGLTQPLQREERTWSYDLSVPTPENVRALVAHPAVEDTANIDRDRGVVLESAPRGVTVTASGRWIAWRDAALVTWIAMFCAASVLVSGVWLLRSRHAAPDAERA